MSSNLKEWVYITMKSRWINKASKISASIIFNEEPEYELVVPRTISCSVP
jgi:hypothetical protein